MQTIFHIDVNSAYLSLTVLDKVLNKDDKSDLRKIPPSVDRDKES